MKHRTQRWPVLVFALLLLASCKDKHDPLKPTVTQQASAVPASAV